MRHATTLATGRRLGGLTPGIHLDDAGRRQAESTARRLVDLPVAAVYASPLERTVETAKIIARPHRCRVRQRPGITEVDFGEWTNRPLGHLRRRNDWVHVQQTPSRFTFPSGESLRAAQTRAVDAIEELVAEHPDETIVVVSHADVIKAVVAFHLGMPLDTFQRLVVAPASVTVLALDAHNPARLLHFNDTGSVAGTAP
ncbi:MAG: MSMEG_4193 family putative phosphomutase [Nitriliruptoraceae bacterium]